MRCGDLTSGARLGAIRRGQVRTAVVDGGMKASRSAPCGRVWTPVDTAWRSVNQKVTTWSAYAPGEGHPLHLSHHTMAPIDTPDDEGRVTWLTGSEADRRGVLVVDRYAGWYRTLAHLGSSLPALSGNRSWRVDVICTPIGHLGTYRRSRLTGRCFSTRHRVHQAGWTRPMTGTLQWKGARVPPMSSILGVRLIR